MDPKLKACPICHGLGSTEGGGGWGPRKCLSCGGSGKVRDDSEHQPAPDSVWATVIRDMAGRDAIGLRKYGRPLQPGDGRDTLWDLYEELLDAVVYLRKAIIERDSQEITAPISVPDPTALPGGWVWSHDDRFGSFARRPYDGCCVWLARDSHGAIVVRGSLAPGLPNVVAAVKAKNGVG